MFIPLSWVSLMRQLRAVVSRVRFNLGMPLVSSRYVYSYKSIGKPLTRTIVNNSGELSAAALLKSSLSRYGCSRHFRICFLSSIGRHQRTVSDLNACSNVVMPLPVHHLQVCNDESTRYIAYLSRHSSYYRVLASCIRNLAHRFCCVTAEMTAMVQG
jgi:hypothetical protein